MNLEQHLCVEPSVLFSFGKNLLELAQKYALHIDESESSYERYKYYLDYMMSQFENQMYFYDVAEKMMLSNIGPHYLKAIN